MVHAWRQLFSMWYIGREARANTSPRRLASRLHYFLKRHRNHVGQWTLFHLMSRFPLAVQRTCPTSAGALNQE